LQGVLTTIRNLSLNQIKLPWKTINESLISIQGLTTLNYIYNNDESDPLQSKNLPQRNLDKFLLSVLPPWKILLAFMWKSNENVGSVFLIIGNDFLG
jgi:hypothetical protein